MDAETIVLIITGATALLGSLGTAGWTLVKYKDAHKKELEAEKKQFYMYTASNIVREAERMFGDGRGEEKKQYAMTRLQNEAVSSSVEWNPKLASTSIEQAVALRNDYKNQDVSIADIIKKETDKEIEEAELAKEEAEAVIKTNLEDSTATVSNTVKSIIIKKGNVKDTKDKAVTSIKED